MTRLIGMLAGISLLVLAGGLAQAQTADDPLHGIICTGAGTGCSGAADNGSFTPLPAGQVANWGFNIDPAPQTGSLQVIILVPTNEIANLATFTLPTLTNNGGSITDNVFSRTNLFSSTSGDLSAYLGDVGSFKPTDNFSNASAGETAAINPTWPGLTTMNAGDFLAFTVTLANVTLSGSSATTTADDFSFGSNLPGGTVFVGLFTANGGGLVGTAASGDLVVTPTAVAATPLPAALPMFIGGLGVLGIMSRRRKQKASASIFA